MPIKINSDGSWVQEYTGPYAGLTVQAPETNIPDNASPAFSNIILRNAEIRSIPALTQFSEAPLGTMVGISAFQDINGTWHTVLWNGDSLYQYNPAASPVPWISVGQACPGDLLTNPVSYKVFGNKIYYCSVGLTYTTHSQRGSIAPFLGYWDGIAAAPVFTQTFSDASESNSYAGISKTDSPTVGGSLPGAPTVTGPLSIGGAYLGELNNYLLLANISVKDEGTGVIYNYPNLLWWSANGIPGQWDPTQNTSAGFNPFLDVPDQITGLMTTGIAGYLFRKNGITQFAPTGSSLTPWEFDHMWASEHGIGNVHPWSIAQYGPTGAFVSADNIYSLSITNAEPIGGMARDAIFADLANAFATPFATIVPYFTSGYVYLTYEIWIPLNNAIRVYAYSFEDKNWMQWDLNLYSNPPFSPISCAPNVV